MCYICEKKIKYKHSKDKKYCKVTDHCHYRGEYRSSAHGICNLKYSIPKKIPILFHHKKVSTRI